MRNEQYIPMPIDVSDIEIPTDLMVLGEKIAKNVHEVWAQGRIREGWKYGPQRCDERKEHPCLIPYEELTESEKEYDRNTAFGTIKLIRKLGYEIAATQPQ